MMTRSNLGRSLRSIFIQQAAVLAILLVSNPLHAQSRNKPQSAQAPEQRTGENIPAKALAETRYLQGKRYLGGRGIKQDDALAAEQFGLAAFTGSGHNGALYELGMLYLEGKGVGQDYAQAAKLFQKSAHYNEAADQPGSPDAQFALSSLYSSGKGVAQSDIEAIKYLRMAARADHTKAQYGLGAMFATGKGVPQSINIAYLWFARAAEGSAVFRSFGASSRAVLAEQFGTAQAIKARDSIRSRLSAEQIANAQVLVDRCVASSYACNWGE